MLQGAQNRPYLMLCASAENDVALLPTGEKKEGQGGVGIGVKGRRGNCRNERRSREGDHGGSARREEGTLADGRNTTREPERVGHCDFDTTPGSLCDQPWSKERARAGLARQKTDPQDLVPKQVRGGR